DPPQVLEVDGAHASPWLRSCDSAASGIRSAWTNREDFEVASNGYGVQNDRLPTPTPAPGPPAAARNDSTKCHASVFGGRCARASTCQTWSPRAITLHGIGHLAAKRDAQYGANPKSGQ